MHLSKLLAALVLTVSFSQVALADKFCSLTEERMKVQEIDPSNFCKVELQDLEGNGDKVEAAVLWGHKNCTMLNESKDPQPCLQLTACSPKTSKGAGLYSNFKLRAACNKANKEKKKMVDLGCAWNNRNSKLFVCWDLHCDGMAPAKVTLSYRTSTDKKALTKDCGLPSWAKTK